MSESYSVISEVFIGDPVNFREDIFGFWLRGLSTDMAIRKMKENMKIDDANDENTEEFISEDVFDSVPSIALWLWIVSYLWFLQRVTVREFVEYRRFQHKPERIHVRSRFVGFFSPHRPISLLMIGSSSISWALALGSGNDPFFQINELCPNVYTIYSREWKWCCILWNATKNSAPLLVRWIHVSISDQKQPKPTYAFYSFWWTTRKVRLWRTSCESIEMWFACFLTRKRDT